MSLMLNLSVITLTCDRLQKLLDCLDRLLPQLDMRDEWILLDTGSTDGTIEHIQSLDHPVIRLIHWQDRQGSWAEMRNYAVGFSLNPVITFLDDDCLPDEHWVRAGKDAIRHADAVGGIVSPWHVPEFPCWWHPGMGWMTGLCEPGHMTGDTGRTSYPFTANLWVRKSVCMEQPFQEVGGRLEGWESGKYTTGREDAEWWCRLRTAGYRTRFNRQLGVSHHFDADLRLTFNYMNKRARLDGTAWAMREGSKDDIDDVAYQCWQAVFSALAGAACFRQSYLPQFTYGYLMWKRHTAALAELVGRNSSTGRAGKLFLILRNLAIQGSRLLFHQAKNILRHVYRPFNRQKTGKKFPAGIPAGASKPHDCRSGCIKRLMIVGFGYLGDLILLQSAMRGLHDTHAEIDIHLLVPGTGRFVFGDLPGIHMVTLPSGNEMAGGTRQSIRWLRQHIVSVDPDLIMAPYLHGDWGSSLTCIPRLPCPVLTFDHDHELSRKRFLDRIEWKICKDLRFHEVENILGMFSTAGFTTEARPPVLKPKLRITDPFIHSPHSEQSPLVMLNPDAGKPYKEWADQSWQKLIEDILNRTGMRIVINNSRARHAFSPARFSQSSRMHSLERCSLEEISSWMSQCSVLVTVDAGPQHIAHALGVPSLTLFGPMDERRWKDYFNRPIHRTIRGCTPFLSPREKAGLAVNLEVLLIRPEDVFEAMISLVENVESMTEPGFVCTGES
jgi:ADP-heptose:LPS heptosyltransferase/glycosyltransferase involved in cell wall biosynthesis